MSANFEESPSPLELVPAHRSILEEYGWLPWVEQHVDRVEYYPWPGFKHPVVNGAIGLAVHHNGERIAQIATQGRDDVSIVATIIHEAGHLAGVAQYGTCFGEETAKSLERRFRNQIASRREPVPYLPSYDVPLRVLAGALLFILLLFVIRDWAAWNGETVMTTAHVRLHALPTTYSAAITVIDRNTLVPTRGRFLSWLRVEHEGHTGFVHVNYVAPIILSSTDDDVKELGQ